MPKTQLVIDAVYQISQDQCNRDAKFCSQHGAIYHVNDCIISVDYKDYLDDNDDDNWTFQPYDDTRDNSDDDDNDTDTERYDDNDNTSEINSSYTNVKLRTSLDDEEEHHLVDMANFKYKKEKEQTVQEMDQD